MDKNISELIRFSRFRKDMEIFSPYIAGQLLKQAFACEQNDLLAYAGAISEDHIQVLFTADGHTMKRVAERLGICYAAVVVSEIMEVVETNNQLGEILLNAENDAFDNKYSFGMVALWIEDKDLCCYLHVADGKVHIATVETGKSTYFINSTSDAICWLKKDGSIIRGMKNIYKFAPSDGRKYEGRPKLRRAN